jgi:hypothetical protein
MTVKTRTAKQQQEEFAKSPAPTGKTHPLLFAERYTNRRIQEITLALRGEIEEVAKRVAVLENGGSALAARLKERFPWLGTDEDVNGADVVEALSEFYEELKR